MKNDIFTAQDIHYLENMINCIENASTMASQLTLSNTLTEQTIRELNKTALELIRIGSRLSRIRILAN